MLGLIFLYFVGRAFYRLAELYKQNKWLYGILGVVVYYAGIIFSAVAIGVIGELVSPGSIDGFEESGIALLTVPIGILCCWGFYKLLEHKWKKIVVVEIESIDEIGKAAD
ncbi:hypothetical protein [Flavobacterium sp.]|jgi:hypothetical protein|uniref:hypothetical protein n=1 Tax=Flavobacterium sp. TaxID=239 RepID=UPI0037C1A822